MSFATGMARRESGPPFQGLRVFLPRNYVPPERYSALQDALTHEGAEVCPNLNPFSNSKVDYHVLADTQVDKIKEMRAKGCRVVGPECVFRCARDSKRLPDREYTCCLALQGVSILLTGFAGEEKNELEELVSSMDGTPQQQTVPEIDFVVAKDVLANKYKWACDVVRKPVIMSSWLQQCAREHRQIPHEPYRLPAFAGLRICASGILFEDRSRIQEAAPLHGATYCPDLTKECSHLIALVPEGRKFVAATTWGLKVVTQNWFWESIKHKMSLDETLFPVLSPTVQDTRIFVTAAPAVSEPAKSPSFNNELSASEPEGSVDIERRQSSGGDTMYLSGCRIFLTGFSGAEMRKLVNLVLLGGGTRHMEINDSITHIILGSLPESGMEEIRQLAMWGAVYVLQPAWLEDCTRQKRELPTDHYLVPQSLLLQGEKEQRATPTSQYAGRGSWVDTTGGASGGVTERGVTPPAKVNGSLDRSKDATLERLELPGPTPKCFAGRVFSFASEYPADQRDEVMRRVLAHGGVWEANASCAEYVLAPHGTALVDSKAVYVSKYWIAQCVEEGKLLDSQSHTLFRPLPCDIPLTDFQDVKFCVSQYGDRDRKLLRKLCRVLGVKFTETFNSRVTHLLCKVKAGQKYENAERLGVQCITADWLYACAAQNKAVSTELFQPRELTAAEKEVEHTFTTQRPGQVASHPLELLTQVSDQSNVPLPSQTTTFTSKTTRTTTSRVKVQTRRNNRSSGTVFSADVALSSQAQGSRLDPWDASAPSVAEVARNSKIGVKPSQESVSQMRPATGRSSLRQGSSRGVQSGDGALKSNIDEASLAEGSKAMEADPSEVNLDVAGESTGMEDMRVGGVAEPSAAACNSVVDNNGSEEGTANVVDAIEGLLRQTSKVKGGDAVEVTEVHKDLISPEAATLSRRTREETHSHATFKKPKAYPSKVEGDSKSPNVVPNQEDSLRFDESQLDSQTVAYDEDHSERQNLMERVRTRSSSVSLASNNSVGARLTDKSAAAWKGDQKLGRLFKAAEANK